ncbi:hypothetical protein, partial [Yoonia sp.]|uniref:hypothetical protein n=1 Tax=Yoonia sp. TaxID=2212373 RepID=UPI00238E594C
NPVYCYCAVFVVTKVLDKVKHVFPPQGIARFSVPAADHLVPASYWLNPRVGELLLTLECGGSLSSLVQFYVSA